MAKKPTPPNAAALGKKANNLAKLLGKVVALSEPTSGSNGSKSSATNSVERPWIVSSQKLVAEFFHVSTETVKDWRKKGMPGTPGRYDLSAIVRWKAKNIGVSGRNDSGDETRTEADRRTAVANAELKEMKVQIMRREYASVKDMIRESLHSATHARALFEQAPDAAIGLLPPAGTVMEEGDHKRIRDAWARSVSGVIRTIYDGLRRRATEFGVPLEADGQSGDGDDGKQSGAGEPSPTA